VRGWEYLAGLPHVGEAEREEGNDEEVEATANIDEVKEELEDGEWSAEQLEQQLDELLRVDHVSLLVEHDSFIDEQASVSPLHIRAYLPDFLIPQYDVLRDTLLPGLQILGIIDGSSSAASEANKAREKLNHAERSLNQAQRDLEQAKKELVDLFDPTRYGAQGEWKKLHDLCLKKDTGGYEYEVCLFEGTRQLPTNGGSSYSLGRFASWNPSPDVVEGSKEYYSTQMYLHGTRCWNGPERSVKLELTCGTENALLTVTELEKCEYLFTGTTPALCLPPAGGTEPQKDEL